MTKPIPEIPGKPLLGIVGQFTGAPSPAHFMADTANQYEDIVRFKLFHRTYHLISSPEIVQEILVKKYKSFRKDERDTDLLSRIIGRGLVTNSDYESHKTQRRLAQPAFHARRIMAYGDTMVDYTERVAAAWQPNSVQNLREEMEKLTMYIVCKTLFDADMDSMRDIADQIGHALVELQAVTDESFDDPIMLPTWLPTSRNRRLKKNRALLDQTIDKIIADRRAEGAVDKGDLLSMLLLAEYEDGSTMTNEQVRDELVTMFVAGHETTSNALLWTWYLLSQNHDVEVQLHAELDAVLGHRLPTMHDLNQLPYLEMVLKESMRLFPPAWVLNVRRTNEEVQVGDYVLPADTGIFVSPYALHHNERIFPDAERFDPERFSAENEPNIPKYGYIPFGAGPRVCIGNSFAMMEMKLIVATLAQKYHFAMQPDQQIELLPQVTMTNAHGMHMRVTERVNAPQLQFAEA